MGIRGPEHQSSRASQQHTQQKTAKHQPGQAARTLICLTRHAIVIHLVAGLCHRVFPSAITALFIITEHLWLQLHSLRASPRVVAQIVEQDRLQIAFRHAGKEGDDHLAAILFAARLL